MHSRLKRSLVAAALTVTAITGSLVAGPAAQAAPAEPRLVLREVPAQALQDATAAHLVGEYKFTISWPEHGDVRGYAEIYVYSDGQKHLVVCDRVGDNLEPTLQVDPSDAEPLEYQDPNGSHPGCLEHNIWYQVRKFRVGVHKAGDAVVAVGWGEWFTRPLPYPDF